MPPDSRPDRPANAFETFRRLVLGNPPLLDRLRGLPGREQFLQEAVRAASEHGLTLSAEDVRTAIGQALREKTRRLL